MHRELPILLRLVARQKLFRADDAHAAQHQLCAKRALPSAPVGLHPFGAALPAFRPEGRSDLARLLKLIVPVIGNAGAHPEAVEKAAHPTSEESSVRKECVITCKSLWSPVP